jgi:hypothetical protein
MRLTIADQIIIGEPTARQNIHWEQRDLVRSSKKQVIAKKHT